VPTAISFTRAKQSEDPDVIAATVAAPGRRSEASRRLQRAFQRARRLPILAGDDISKKAASRSVRRRPEKHPKRAKDQAADRKAALIFEKKQKRRKREGRGRSA
jgi:DICT domain-containing protein